MYKILNIGGEEYKFEFSIEASLYNDCIEKITYLMISVDSSQKSDTKSMISSVSDIPQTAVKCFYAGLLEHHGAEGDNRVPNEATAKSLVKMLLRDENSEYNTWYDILSLCTEQMREDGFFGLIGLGANEEKSQTVVPQDHKRKVRKVSEN